MSDFRSSIRKQKTTTENGMVTNISTRNYNVDLFFKAGAMRGMDITSHFAKAYEENPDLAMRMALWIRDCREGLGEKEHFRNILRYLSRNGKDYINPRVVVEMGYWKDLLFVLDDAEGFSSIDKSTVLEAIKNGLQNDALCAKWMPRKGKIANKIRKYLELSPKEYRKLLASRTNVVETKMCKNEWDDIIFSAVPSVAMNRYKKAFSRHTDNFGEYIQSVLRGESKINSSVLYPYDIINPVVETLMSNYVPKITTIQKQTIIAQWDALPNYMKGKNVLPMVDVSGSMYAKVANTSAMAIAISLGLYCADKNTGAFKDVFMTFSGEPKIQEISGDIVAKISQISSSKWGMNTSLDNAFKELLRFANKNRIKEKDMPESIIIFSDMEFDRCMVNSDATAFKMAKKAYKEAGYDLPKIIFWNITSRHDNFPVRYNTEGVALVSGFSPNIMKILFNIEEYTPEKVMLETLMKDRYNVNSYR